MLFFDVRIWKGEMAESHFLHLRSMRFNSYLPSNMEKTNGVAFQDCTSSFITREIVNII